MKIRRYPRVIKYNSIPTKRNVYYVTGIIEHLKTVFCYALAILGYAAMIILSITSR